jgi:hypothetical protein
LWFVGKAYQQILQIFVSYWGFQLFCHPDEIRNRRFHPDEITATKISSRLDRRAVPKSSHLTGQVGQAGQVRQAEAHPREIGSAFHRAGRITQTEWLNPENYNAREQASREALNANFLYSKVGTLVIPQFP